MRLTIIIPTLNESLNLKKLLPYLKSNTIGLKTQIVVVDAYSSSDNSSNICNEHGVHYIKSEINQRAAQMNKGAAAFSSEVYLFLHADVFPPVRFFQLIKKAIKEGFGFGLFAYKFDKKKWHININAYFTKYDGFFCGGGDQCHFMTHATFNKLGGYNTDYNLMEDFEFFGRIRKFKIPYTVLQDRALVSARKYEHHSYLRVNLINLISLIRFRLGHSPDNIKIFYGKWL